MKPEKQPLRSIYIKRWEMETTAFISSSSRGVKVRRKSLTFNFEGVLRVLFALITEELPQKVSATRTVIIAVDKSMSIKKLIRSL